MLKSEIALTLNLRVVSPEKMKNSSLPSPPPSLPSEKMKNLSLLSPPPSLTSLPDDIVVNCLARIPRFYYPKLSLVSKSFRSLLSSPELYGARSRLGSTELCLYVCLRDRTNNTSSQWLTLWINPNRTKNKKMKKKKKPLLVSIPSSNLSKTTIVVGSEIYVIGGYNASSSVRVLDCRSNTWRDAPNMNVARRDDAAASVYNGKIYVIGGGVSAGSSFGEVFDTNTQTWERLPDSSNAVRYTIICRMVEIEGKINFGSPFHMRAYDTKQGKWERSDAAMFPRSACVMENVAYSYENHRSGGYWCSWYDINDGKWKQVKGLDSLIEKHKMVHWTSTKLVSFGGKLLAVWGEYTTRKFVLRTNMKRNHTTKIIWCAEISLEKRDEGEVWGNVEWVDIVHTAPESYDLMHCLAVSV